MWQEERAERESREREAAARPRPSVVNYAKCLVYMPSMAMLPPMRPTLYDFISIHGRTFVSTGVPVS